MTDEKPIIPVHQWTHDGDKVLLIKCINADGTSGPKNEFIWPKSGPVKSPQWDGKPTCDGGGLFGWPWGIGIGSGKDPDYQGIWIVWATDPNRIIVVDNEKTKAPDGEVLYYGEWVGAFRMVLQGQIAWIQQSSRGAASATGGQGAASATGRQGAASATGEQGIATITGDEGTIEVGFGGIAAVCAKVVIWKVHKDAVLIQRWKDFRNHYQTAVLYPKKLRLKTGRVVKVVKGKIQKKNSHG